MPLNERLFKISEAELLEFAETTTDFLTTDLMDFSTFDSTITENYVLQIRQSIEQVKSIKSDQVVIDEMAELTQEVKNAMNDCNSAYKSIAFFVKKAFAENQAVQNQFGFNDYRNVNSSQPKFILFMEQLAITVNKYKAELIAEGCKEELINSLSGKAEDFKNADIAQEKFKKERVLITQERTRILNKIYSFLKPLNDIALIIYSDNQAQMNKYIMSAPSGVSVVAKDVSGEDVQR